LKVRTVLADPLVLVVVPVVAVVVVGVVTGVVVVVEGAVVLELTGTAVVEVPETGVEVVPDLLAVEVVVVGSVGVGMVVLVAAVELALELLLDGITGPLLEAASKGCRPAPPKARNRVSAMPDRLRARRKSKPRRTMLIASLPGADSPHFIAIPLNYCLPWRRPAPAKSGQSYFNEC